MNLNNEDLVSGISEICSDKTYESNVILNKLNDSYSSILNNFNEDPLFDGFKFDADEFCIDYDKYLIEFNLDKYFKNNNIGTSKLPIDTLNIYNEQSLDENENNVILDTILHRKNKDKKNYLNSYLYRIKEYYGVVLQINDSSNEQSFECILTDVLNGKEIITSFSYDDITFESDREMVSEGAHFTLLVGMKRDIIKTENGPKMNGHQKYLGLFFRRNKKLNKKELESAYELQKSWAELFNS